MTARTRIFFSLVLGLLLLPAGVRAGDDYQPQSDEKDEKGEEAEEKPAKGESGVGLSWDEDADENELTRARRKPYTRRCKEYDDDESEERARQARIDYAASHLGGEHTRRAWKDLLKLGTVGCDAVAEWLLDGGPGGLAADHADASKELILYGKGRHVRAGTAWLGDPDPAVPRGIASALRRRLVALDEAALKVLVEQFHVGDRAVSSETLLGILVGYYTETYTYTTYSYVNGVSIPIVNTYTVWYYASEPPPLAHVEALRGLLVDAGNKWADEATNTLRARAMYRGGENQDRWAPLLLELARDKERGPDVVDKAAHALGWMQPEGSRAIAETLLEDQHAFAQLAYLKGLRSRAKKGYGDVETVKLMNLFAKARDKEVSRTAAKWTKVWGRKLAR